MIVVTSGVQSLDVYGWCTPYEQLSLSARGLRTEDLRQEARDHPIGVFAELVAESKRARLSIFSPQVWRGEDKALECHQADVTGSGIAKIQTSEGKMCVDLFAPDINSPISASVTPVLPRRWNLADQGVRRAWGADRFSISALKDPNTKGLTLSVSMEIFKESTTPTAHVSLSVQGGFVICAIRARNGWPEDFPALVLCHAEQPSGSWSTALTLIVWPAVPRALTEVMTEQPRW